MVEFEGCDDGGHVFASISDAEDKSGSEGDPNGDDNVVELPRFAGSSAGAA
jgi:hypothetical protein